MFMVMVSLLSPCSSGIKKHNMEPQNGNIWNGKHLLDGPYHQGMLMHSRQNKERELERKDLFKTRR